MQDSCGTCGRGEVEGSGREFAHFQEVWQGAAGTLFLLLFGEAKRKKKGGEQTIQNACKQNLRP